MKKSIIATKIVASLLQSEAFPLSMDGVSCGCRELGEVW